MFKDEEMLNSSHWMIKEKEGRRIVAIDAFNMAKKRIQELKNKLAEANRDKKSAKAALEGAERQAEGQRRQLHQTKDLLATSKEQITALKKNWKRPSRTVMTLRWQRPMRPLGLRSRRYVGTTASKYRMRPLTKLGLMSLLHSREQRAYNTLLPSMH